MTDYRNTPFGDPSLDTEKRLDWLVDSLSLEEKFKLLSSSPEDIDSLSMKVCGFGGEAAHGVEGRNDQNGLKIPDITTSFPEPIGMSASWDTEAIRAAGEVTGKEARVVYHRHDRGGLSRWAPTVDLERSPRWGRNEEGYGEDPVLTGAMASAYVQGMQGDHPRYLRIAATLKHFYANNVEFGRGRKNSSVDPRNKYEYYLEAFRRVIQDGGAEAIMSAYNRINGTQGLFNTEIQKLLKDKYGLGHAVSDGGAMALVVSYSHDNGLDAETVARSVKAGVDAMSDDPAQVEAAAREAYELGLLTEADMDKAIRNTFRTRLKLGIYDRENLNPFDNVTEEDILSEENEQICRILSEKSLVLLKNKGLLPLGETNPAKNTVLIGPVADEWYPDWYGGRPPYRITVKEGLESLVSETLGERFSFDEEHFCDGRDRVFLAAGDRYLAADDESGRLVLSDSPEEFIMDDWGENAYSFRSVRTGKYICTRLSDGSVSWPDGVKGEIYANAEDILSWFALETVHMASHDDGTVILQSRFGDPFCSDDRGRIYAGEGTYLHIKIEIVRNGIERAKKIAGSADRVILVLGHNPMINAKEETDRESIRFIPYQQKLFDELYKANPDLIVVLLSDYPFAINEINDKAGAILWSATGSQYMGTAVAETLVGRSAPSGRLPQTWYREDVDAGDMINDYDIINNPRTYRYFEGDVLYPFGYGLTYTSFEYSDLSAAVHDGSRLKVSLNITNTGTTVSDEVVELYAVPPKARVKKPLRQLIAFERVKDIEPGETVDVEFDISSDELRFYDVTRETLIVEEGTYRFFAGPDSLTEAVSTEVFVPGLKAGTRDLSQKIKADHYDIQKGSQIVEGCFGLKALMTADTYSAYDPHPMGNNGEFSAEYGACLIPSGAKQFRIHAYAPDKAELRIYADDKELCSFAGDTRAYETRPRNNMDSLPRAVADAEELRRSWPVIWADIRLDVGGSGIPSGPCTIRIEADGPVKFDWFEFI